MPMSCIAVGCLNYVGRKDSDERKVSYYHFPRKNSELMKKWVAALRRPKNFWPKQYARLCSDHFEEDCFEYEHYKKNVRVLKRDTAIPTKFINSTPKKFNDRKRRSDRRRKFQAKLQGDSDLDEIRAFASEVVECVYEENQNPDSPTSSGESPVTVKFSSRIKNSSKEKNLSPAEKESAPIVVKQPTVLPSTSKVFQSPISVAPNIIKQSITLPSASTFVQSSSQTILQSSQAVALPNSSVILIISSPVGTQPPPIILQATPSGTPSPSPLFIQPPSSATAAQFTSSSSPSLLTLNMAKNTSVKRTLESTSSETDSKRERLDSEDDRSDGSNYLDLIQKRKQQHMEFFQSLNINRMKDEIDVFLSASKAERTKNRSRTVKPKLRMKEEMPARKSLRLQNKPASDIPDPSVSYQVEERPKKKKIRGVVSFAIAAKESGDKLPESFVKDLQFLKDAKPVASKSTTLTNYLTKFENMRIVDSLVGKLAYSRIYCVSTHPSPEKILFATGSRDGEVSFWDVESRARKDPLLFIPHSERVSCLQFSPHNLCELYTSSYDGSMRCGDLTKGIFDEIFSASADEDSDILCTSFDFLSPSTFLVSLWHGYVTLVDKRTKNIQGEKDFKVQDCVAKTVSVHPMKKDYFVVAGGNGIASLWDLRNSKKKSICELSHERTLNSAYFSPITGNYILTTSMDDRLSIFDSSSLDAKIKLQKAIKHNNHTGRWLAPLRATWLPNCEEGFLVGSMEQPRRIEVYGINGKREHIFAGESLCSVCSANAIHPSRSALAGANSSGKLHVFLSPE